MSFRGSITCSKEALMSGWFSIGAFSMMQVYRSTMLLQSGVGKRASVDMIGRFSPVMIEILPLSISPLKRDASPLRSWTVQVCWAVSGVFGLPHAVRISMIIGRIRIFIFLDIIMKLVKNKLKHISWIEELKSCVSLISITKGMHIRIDIKSCGE